jgi:DnaJ like chaperone protein
MQIIEAFLTLIFTLISGILSIGFRLIVAVAAGVIAVFKGRNAFFWGLITLIFPWSILILFFLPAKQHRIKTYLSEKPEFKQGNVVVGALMALTATVAKADGQVTKEEVHIIRQFVTQNFRITGAELNQYEGAFNYGKDHPEDLDEYIRILRSYHHQRDFIMSISYLLVMVAVKNGAISEKEDQLVSRITFNLGLSPYEYESIKRYIVGRMSGAGSTYSSAGSSTYNGYNQGMSKDVLVEKYTKVLGLPKNADEGMIKKAYRKMAKEYHPDKVMSEGMPDEYIEYANKRFSEISHAYEQLKTLVFE